MVEYKIVHSATYRGLGERVESLLNDGWQLYGNFTYVPTRNSVEYVQVVIKNIIVDNTMESYAEKKLS